MDEYDSKRDRDRELVNCLQELGASSVLGEVGKSLAAEPPNKSKGVGCPKKVDHPWL